MKILRFDSVGGASGDMILAALMALGAKPAALRSALATLPLDPFRLQVRPASDHGLSGIQVDVVCARSHSHRRIRDIRRIIHRSRLPARVKDLSLDVFRRLAVAEARVHGMKPESVTFHEVGAVDSIVDIVGSCLALHTLGVDRIEVGPLPMGRGQITGDHGVLPIPVPAVAELLKDFPVVQTEEPFEMVTPSGAAILTAWQSRLGVGNTGVPETGRLLAVGTGIGHARMHHRPNILRAILIETTPSPNTGTADACLVLECHLDDTIPELIGSLSQILLRHGALDVATAPIYMKKQRPGTRLTVLCKPADSDLLKRLIFTETTTFGIREYLTRRTVLTRRHIKVKTPYGIVRVKIGTLDGTDITRSPEHEDCLKAATARGIPVRTVYEATLRGLARIKP